MLLTDILYENINSYQKAGIKVRAIALGYSQFFYLSQVIKIAALQQYEQSNNTDILQGLMQTPMTYLGYSIYPVAKENAIEFLFQSGEDAVKAANIQQLGVTATIDNTSNVIPFKRNK